MARGAPRRTTDRTSKRAAVHKKAAKPSASRRARASRAVQGLSQPKSPMPPQNQEKPEIESKLTPRPHVEAPHYRGLSKLEDKVALITGGYSGIGRAVAVLFAPESAP